MPRAESIDIPAHGLLFAAQVSLDAAQAGAPRRFSGVAYGGGVITDHGWWDAVAFDLAGLQAPTPMPLLLQHDHDRAIGVIDTADASSGQLRIGGRIFVGDPEADRVIAKADAGMPWQMSVGIFPDAIEEVQAGAVVNGQAVGRATHVFRKSRVREASFVAVGADGSTHATVFNQAGGCRAPLIYPQESSMADDNREAALAAMTTERDAERTRADAAEAALAALQAQFAARERAERETAVRQMLGDEFSAEAAAPYMDMTPVQFGAVQAAFGALRSKLPAGFTAEQARSGAQGSGGLTADAITEFRRKNPGATYEQAFSALTGAAAAPRTHF